MARRSKRKIKRDINSAAGKQSVGVRPDQAPRSSGKTVWSPIQLFIGGLLIFIVVLTVFWPCTDNQFTSYDDEDYVTNNRQVQQGLTRETFVWAFGCVVSSNWHPVTMLSHLVDWELYGSKAYGHHLTNVLLHSLNATLLFLILASMTGAGWRSLAVAALFALHPLRAESVAWVAERKDVLCATFWLLAFWAYVRYVRVPKTSGRMFYVFSMVLFAIALMAKPMAVTLPFVMLLADYWPLHRIDSRGRLAILLEKIPYFALSAISSIITYAVQQRTGAVQAGFSLSTRIENAAVSYFRYLGKMVWPGGLCVIYPYQWRWPMWVVVVATAALIGITAAAVVLRKKLPWLGVGWLWYAGMLVPMIGIVQVGGQAMADRYTYLPGMGITIAVVWAVAELSARWRAPGWVLAVVLVAIVCTLTVLTRNQIGYWKNDDTLFSHALDVEPENEIAYEHLSYFLRLEKDRDRTIEVLERGIKALPQSPTLRSDLGVCYKDAGRFPEAEVQFDEALRLNPDFAEAGVGLAAICLKEGRKDEAIALLQRAVKSRPDLAIARKLLKTAMDSGPP